MNETGLQLPIPLSSPRACVGGQGGEEVGGQLVAAPSPISDRGVRGTKGGAEPLSPPRRRRETGSPLRPASSPIGLACCFGGRLRGGWGGRSALAASPLQSRVGPGLASAGRGGESALEVASWLRSPWIRHCLGNSFCRRSDGGLLQTHSPRKGKRQGEELSGWLCGLPQISLGKMAF